MSLHTLHSEKLKVYFCTITCYKWLPLIQESNSYSSVYRWFKHLKNDGCFVLGYVIMPNHFHVLLFLSHTGTGLNHLVGDCKRFMAYDIVNSLRRQGKESLLQELQFGVQRKEKLKGKIHQVFKTSFDAKQCFNECMIEQKLEYIHHNPVKGKWKLVDDFTDYPHSSAGFYELDRGGVVEIRHYKDLN